MRFFSLLSSFFVVAILSIGGSVAHAATQTSDVSLKFSGFGYDSNFWAGIMPGATVGGAAPVSQVDLAFTLESRVPAALVYAIGYREPIASALSVSIVSEDVAGLSSAGESVTSATLKMFMKPYAGASGNTYGLLGRLDVYTAGSTVQPYFRMSFDLPTYFEGAPDLSGASATYDFNSPKAFDAPRYRAMALGGSSVTSTIITPGPVPVPMTAVMALSGLGMLFGVLRLPRLARA